MKKVKTLIIVNNCKIDSGASVYVKTFIYDIDTIGGSYHKKDCRLHTPREMQLLYDYIEDNKQYSTYLKSMELLVISRYGDDLIL